jgi:hypothetical protein
MASMLDQLLFDDVGDRRFAGTGQPGEPEHARALQLVLGSLQSMQLHLVPGEIVAGFHHLAPEWVFRFRQH